MVSWNSWLDKKVYIELNNSSHPFSGKIVEVNDSEMITYITIIDKYAKRVCFVTSEIKLIKEEL
jgi:hypothetical protein